MAIQIKIVQTIPEIRSHFKNSHTQKRKITNRRIGVRFHHKDVLKCRMFCAKSKRISFKLYLNYFWQQKSRPFIKFYGATALRYGDLFNFYDVLKCEWTYGTSYKYFFRSSYLTGIIQ